MTNNISDNSIEMAGIVVSNYSMMRFRILLESWLSKAKDRIPELKHIIDILPEDLGGSLNNRCDCEEREKHHLRYVYKLIMDNGQQITAGARCLENFGYPLSLSRRLEKIRRTIQRDIDTIEILEEESARAITSVYQSWAQIIAENRYCPGIFFLRDFGSVMNDFVECGRDIPQWLRFSLRAFYKDALREAPSLKERRAIENKERHKEQWKTLLRVNEKVFRRNAWVNDMLKKIEEGTILSPNEVNRINVLQRQYNNGSIDNTEKALPFLTALTNGSIVLTEFDTKIIRGRDKPLFLSLYDYIQHNVVLSEGQLELLRKKFQHSYGKQFQKLPQEVRMTTADLVTVMKSLNDVEDNEKIAQIKSILAGRNVDLALAVPNSVI